MSEQAETPLELQLPPERAWTSNSGQIECGLVIGTFEPCGAAIERDYEDDDGEYVCEYITDPHIVLPVIIWAWRQDIERSLRIKGDLCTQIRKLKRRRIDHSGSPKPKNRAFTIALEERIVRQKKRIDNMQESAEYPHAQLAAWEAAAQGFEPNSETK